MTDAPTLLDEITPVRAGGFCVGCGACAVACPAGIKMARTADGIMQPTVTDATQAAATAGGVCPFSDATPDETAVAQSLFPDAPQNDPKLGRFTATYAGHVIEDSYRATGSSGGMTSWIAAELLRRGEVDAVVHVHAQTEDTASALFAYSVSRSPADVQAGAKTRYYSVDFANALRTTGKEGTRFAVIGVPCFIKAARHLAATDPVIGAGMAYGIALICGHMKAAGFAESLAWQSGVRPDDVHAVDFRKKLPGRPADRYGFETWSGADTPSVVKPMSALVGRNWDGGYFKLKACEFCDDVVGETADIALGDAWLRRYTKDYQGTNVVLVRTAALNDILQQAVAAGRIALDPLTSQETIATQSAGFRDRRDALQYRLWRAARQGGWHPTKRVTPSRDHLTPVRRATIRLRGWIRRRSFASYRLSKKLGTIRIYQAEMTLYHAGLKGLGLIERKLYGRR